MKATDIYSLFEAQQELFEVNMSPSNLKKLAGTIPDAKVGIEYEMQIPGVFDDSSGGERSGDEGATDIDDICTFFDDDNGNNDISRLRDRLQEEFWTWQSEQIYELWRVSDGREYFAKYCRENATDEEVLEYLGRLETVQDQLEDDEDISASKSEWEDYINQQWNDEDGLYDDARSEFEEDYRDEFYDERQFLRDNGIRMMSDVPDNYPYIRWPTSMDTGVQELALNFMNYMGLDSVAYLGSDEDRYYYYEDGYWEDTGTKPYHLYIFEPDSSLAYQGPELVGPTQSLEQTLQDSLRIRKWANKNDATTSIKGEGGRYKTGLHMNISIPGFNTDKLDYVKLAVLLGDQYILDQFDRYGSYYAKSALDIVKDRAKDKDNATRLLNQLKTNMNEIASKVIHSGRTDKFTSINTKGDRVEFRSPGGDWLSGSFEKYENALRRFIVALDAACDPDKYKKEYESKLHTILTGDKTVKYYDPNDPENRLPGPNGPGTGAVNPIPKKFITADDFEGDTQIQQERNLKAYLKKNRKNLRTYIQNDKALGNLSKLMAGEINTSQYIRELEQTRKERLRGEGIRILQPNEVEENDWVVEYNDGVKQDTIYIANTDKVATEEAAFNAAKKFKPQWFRPNTLEYVTIKPYKFDEALSDLKMYRAEFGHKYTSVVAKDEEQAREFIRTMNPELFEVEPDREIIITDEDETSKRKIKQVLDWQEDKLRSGREYIIRPKIWIARGVPSEPAFSDRYYIAAVSRNDALAVLKQLDPGFEIRDIYVNDSMPSQDYYESYKTAQEDLIRQQDAERTQRQAAQDETIDVSNLRGWRVSNSTTYMYVVAENGAEAAEIANKMDPERFPDVSDMTVQTAGTIGAETLIRGMYARQQSVLGNQQPSAPKLEVNDRVKVVGQFPSLIGMVGTVLQVIPNLDFVSVRLDGNDAASSFPTSALKKIEDTTSNNDSRTYTVTNTETGQARRFIATSQEDAVNVARREYPALFSTLNVTAAVDSSSSNTRISDLRYYRVQRQDASGRADVAAYDPEDAMNRVRLNNPTWRNSPLTAELL